MAQIYDDSFKIQGNNYRRQDCTVTMITEGGILEDITQYIKGVDYTSTLDKQFDYTLGSVHPSHLGIGTEIAEGTITTTDAGLNKLNELAVGVGVQGFLNLGDVLSMSLQIEYVTNNKKIKTDLLENVHFTTYSNGVNTDDVLYSREISMIIGRINVGIIG